MSHDDKPPAAAEPPDPSGPPTPVASDWLQKAIDRAAPTAIVAFVGVPLITATMLPALGATRSARICRDERAREMAEDVARFEQAEADVDDPAPKESP